MRSVSNVGTFECTSVSVDCQVQPTVASDLVVLLWGNQEESEKPGIIGTLGK